MSGFVLFPTLRLSVSSLVDSLGLNNISPERDGTEGKKKGAFSGFLGGSIGLLRAWKIWDCVQN